MCLNCESNENQRTLGIVPTMPAVVPVEPSGECVECGDEVRGADCHTDNDGAVYCTDHYERKYTECQGCNEETLRADAVEGPDGNGYCESCASDQFTTCDNCSDCIWSDDAHGVSGHRRWSVLCESCYDAHYADCSSCGEATNRDNLRTGHDGDDYCDECFWEHNRECSGCGEIVNSDYCTYDENRDGDYCESCYRGNEDYDAKRFRPSDLTYTRIGSRRRFGVELETSKCDGHEDLDGRFHFGAKDDGSITGKEFVSTVLAGDQGLDAIAAFCDYAEENGFKVDSACGFHAHFDVGNESTESLKAIGYAYLLTQRVWQSFVSASRRNNHYCGSIEWSYTDIANANDFRDWADGWDRYCWFNVASYAVHGTFEIRLHTASLNAEKVNNWVKAHTRFIDKVAGMTIGEVRAMFAGKTAQELFDALVDIWGDEELSHFYRRRAELFGTSYTVKRELSAVA